MTGVVELTLCESNVGECIDWSNPNDIAEYKEYV